MPGMIVDPIRIKLGGCEFLTEVYVAPIEGRGLPCIAPQYAGRVASLVVRTLGRSIVKGDEEDPITFLGCKKYTHARGATSNETVKGFVGESVTFVCPKSDKPRNRFSFAWKKYSHGISQGPPNAAFQDGSTSPGYIVGSNLSLTIEIITPDDEGVYVCNQTATEMSAGVLHTVYFSSFAIPATSPHIDGCGNDGVQCEQRIAAGTKAFFTCTVKNIYPEWYPTWGEEKEYREKITNSDGTFNTSSSVTVKGTDISADRVCSFVMEGFNASSHLTITGL
ncbi:uncharacterized protein [Diadema setosum]|uniref:uncharacterized protein n=1 Tax=Diadema setosum TaxID=31175 RepID=UPI003B3B9719